MGWRRRIPIPWLLLLTLAMNASSLETSSVVVASKATDPMVGLRGRGDGVSRMGAQTWEAPKAAIDGDTDSSASSARKLGDKAEGQLRKLTRLLPRKRNEGEGETRQEEGHCMGKGDTSSSLPRLRSGSKNQGVQPNGAAHRKGGAGRNRPGYGTSLQQCAVDDCGTYASYGLPGQLGRSIVCARHRYPGTVDRLTDSYLKLGATVPVVSLELVCISLLEDAGCLLHMTSTPSTINHAISIISAPLGRFSLTGPRVNLARPD